MFLKWIFSAVTFQILLQAVAGDYVVSIFLAEFKNPSGLVSNGTFCDTFYWTGKDDCDMSFIFCVETAGQRSGVFRITDDLTSCSSGWYNFGRITVNDNYAEFRTDNYYGHFYNGQGFPVQGDFALNVPVFQLKIKASDVDEYDEELIDQLAVKVTPSNVYQAHGSFVKFNHFRQKLGPAASTQLIFYYQVRNGTGSTTEPPTQPTAPTPTTTTPLVCQNGGTPSSDGIRCNCPPLFSGKYCQIAPKRNCYDLYKYYGVGEGINTIQLNGKDVQVYCDNGWTLFQRRVDDGLSFNRTWSEYAEGFGNLDGGSFWLGNENIYYLTNGQQTMSMKAVLWDCHTPNPNTAYETYHTFKIDARSTNYTLHVSGDGNEDGSAGDAINQLSFGESENGQQFSTPDGNDNDSFEGDCSNIFHGGWWYGSCGSATLNGIYHPGCNYKLPNNPYGSYFGDGILWKTWYKNVAYSLARTELKLRPNDIQKTENINPRH